MSNKQFYKLVHQNLIDQFKSERFRYCIKNAIRIYNQRKMLADSITGDVYIKYYFDEEFLGEYKVKLDSTKIPYVVCGITHKRLSIFRFGSINPEPIFEFSSGTTDDIEILRKLHY